MLKVKTLSEVVINEGLDTNGNGWGVFFGKRYIPTTGPNKGFITSTEHEQFFTDESKATKCAEKLLAKAKNDEFILSYTLWVVPYSNDRESGKRMPIKGMKTTDVEVIPYAKEREYLDKIRVTKLGLDTVDDHFAKKRNESFMSESVISDDIVNQLTKVGLKFLNQETVSGFTTLKFECSYGRGYNEVTVHVNESGREPSVFIEGKGTRGVNINPNNTAKFIKLLQQLDKLGCKISLSGKVGY